MSEPMKNTNKKPENIFGTRPSPVIFYGIQENQSTREPKLDKKNIRREAAMKTDESEMFITVPVDYPGVKDFDVARTPPTIDFAVVQGLTPWDLPVSEKGLHQSPMNTSEGFGIWSGFGDVSLGPDDCFYFSIGNHLYYDGNAYMIKYDPASKTQSIVFDAQKVCGWKSEQWSDGKIHGDPIIDPDGDMWVITFSGPRPLKDEIHKVPYVGGHLIRHNIFKNTTEDLGVPLEGDTWAYSSYDWKNGVFFAVGQAKQSLLIYDTKKKQMIYGGFPPPDIDWFNRCILIDDDTGKIYSANSKQSGEGTQNLVSWERKSHTFTVMKLQTPIHPTLGQRFPLRAHIRKKDAQGAFWCFDMNGTIFKFHPDQESIEPIGINWDKDGKYTSNLCLSPKGRYLYYAPGAHNKMYEYGTPVVQYDITMNRKKVIAFLNDFYIEQYGYSPYSVFGLELDREGESIFFYTNGLFATKAMGSGYGRPAIFQVHIPQSERIE